MTHRLLTATCLAAATLLAAGCSTDRAEVSFTDGPAATTTAAPSSAAPVADPGTLQPLEELLAAPADFGSEWGERVTGDEDGPLRVRCAAVPAPVPADSAVRGFATGGGGVAETLSRFAGPATDALASLIAIGEQCTSVTVEGATYTVTALPAVPGVQSAGLLLDGAGADRVVYAGIVGDVLAVSDASAGAGAAGVADYGLTAFRIVLARAAGQTPDVTPPAAGPSSGSDDDEGGGRPGGAGAGLVPPAVSVGTSTGGGSLTDPTTGGATVNPDGAGDTGPGNVLGGRGVGEP